MIVLPYGNISGFCASRFRQRGRRHGSDSAAEEQRSGFAGKEDAALINGIAAIAQGTLHFVQPEALIEAGQRCRRTPHMQVVVVILILSLIHISEPTRRS